MFRRLILLLTILLPFAVSNAQNNIDAGEFNSLVQKVDSLENELAYLKVLYELNSINTDLALFSNNMSSSATGVQLNYYNKNYDRELLRSYEGYLQSCRSKLISFRELVDSKKDYALAMLLGHNFSENERSLILGNYRLMDTTLDNCQTSLNLLEASVDAYRGLR